MTLRIKRKIWLPFGYRRVSVRRSRRTFAKQHSEAIMHEASVVARAAPAAITKTQKIVPDTNLEPCEPTIPESSSVAPQVAKFPEAFNPHRAYLNDMMQTLTSMPENAFVDEPSSIPECPFRPFLKPVMTPQATPIAAPESALVLPKVCDISDNLAEDNMVLPAHANRLKNSRPQPHLRTLSGIRSSLMATKRSS
ncbi:hypothetical protein HGP28_03520 [Vibrio sp. SM6]|uniref:Uncharacterized protein n=1 Tax=Vibrio agarilyticus TaxID=2726741 RepID=A0A7X8TNN4_9VIBR|nr:hypothetical protein [Vibrio agarilyticus]NLS11959.1 hypothetical protein [Vibrio agarilyticus]